MRLVVTADDLGIAPGVTRGILETHRDGVVRSTSAVVTFPSSAEGVALALAEPDLEIGVHLDLVGGYPVSDPAEVRTLVDGEGRFHPLPVFTRRLFTARVSARELSREMRAQVERARSWGAPALAWDSHRHTHLLPPVARIVASLARELGARWVRRARAPRMPVTGKALALHASSAVCEVAYHGIPGNRWFLDVTRQPTLDVTALALLPALGGIGEIVAHPGYADGELARYDSLQLERERDLALLTAPLLRRAFGSDAVSWRVLS